LSRRYQNLEGACGLATNYNHLTRSVIFPQPTYFPSEKPWLHFVTAVNYFSFSEFIQQSNLNGLYSAAELILNNM